ILVDLELSDIGDSSWDIGAVLQAYISFWVFSMRFGADLPAAQLDDTAQYPIEKMQPSIRAFWQAYIGTLELERAAAETLLVRSVKYGAARMIQTAYTSQDHWSAGWQLMQTLPNGQIVAVKGSMTRTVWPGEFHGHGPPGVQVAAGGGISLFAPRESRTSQPGFYFAFGEALADQQ